MFKLDSKKTFVMTWIPSVPPPLAHHFVNTFWHRGEVLINQVSKKVLPFGGKAEFVL